MPAPTTIIVVGSSVAGVRTAQGLRREGYSGRLVLVGEERELPYDKPPLSKQYLGGDADDGEILLLTHEMAAELDIELRLGTPAARLDASAEKLILADGAMLEYDVVVLATGAAARPAPWSPESGVYVLRTIADARALRTALEHEHPVVVVGGGFIGAEVAATARACGRDVTIIDPLSAPLGRIVGTELGVAFNELHRRHGVTTEFGVGVESISGDAGNLTVTLTDGRVLRAGTAVVGIGALPNDGWLADSGLDVDNGVACDDHCRALNAENVYVVGDLARYVPAGGPGPTRVEHWTNAVESATTAAHNIVHPDDLRSHAAVEYVWTDQYDWKIQIAGRPSAAAEYELVGTFTGATARGAALYFDDTGRLHGAVTVNWPKALITCRRLIADEDGYAEARTRVRQLADR